MLTVHEQCSEPRQPVQRTGRAVPPKKDDASDVLRDVVDIANHLHPHVEGWAKPHAVQRWLQVIKSLADQSVHEGTEIKYLLGFGPAYLSSVCGRVYEPVPVYLLADASDNNVHRVTHYLKSYFSLFGQKGIICWFDPHGCFRGVFEFEEPSEPASDHLRGEIVGHRKFDICGKKGGDVLARYRDGTFYYPQEKSDELGEQLRIVVTLLVRKLETGKNHYITWLQMLITDLIRGLEERGGACGLVVMLDSSEEEWPSAFQNQRDARLPFDSQYKRLAPKLERFEGPIVLPDDIGKLDSDTDKMKLQRVVDALVPLARLDGAILLRIKPKIGLWCEAACQITPLVEWERNGLLPLDIFNVPSTADTNITLPLYYALASLKARLTLQELKGLADILCGKVAADSAEWLADLAFLNSAGTRHHSLWGITVSAKEPLFTVTISSDGHLRLFCDGRVVFGSNEGGQKSRKNGRNWSSRK